MTTEIKALILAVTVPVVFAAMVWGMLTFPMVAHLAKITAEVAVGISAAFLWYILCYAALIED